MTSSSFDVFNFATASCGGWNRTSGLRVQGPASLPAATAPHHRTSYRLRLSSSLIARRPPLLYQQQLPRIASSIPSIRGEGFEPSSPASKAGSLPLADPRASFLSALRELNPPRRLGRPEPLPLG